MRRSVRDLPYSVLFLLLVSFFISLVSLFLLSFICRVSCYASFPFFHRTDVRVVLAPSGAPRIRSSTQPQHHAIDHPQLWFVQRRSVHGVQRHVNQSPGVLRAGSHHSTGVFPPPVDLSGRGVAGGRRHVWQLRAEVPFSHDQHLAHAAGNILPCAWLLLIFWRGSSQSSALSR